MLLPLWLPSRISLKCIRVLNIASSHISNTTNSSYSNNSLKMKIHRGPIVNRQWDLLSRNSPRKSDVYLWSCGVEQYNFGGRSFECCGLQGGVSTIIIFQAPPIYAQTDMDQGNFDATSKHITLCQIPSVVHVRLQSCSSTQNYRGNMLHSYHWICFLYNMDLSLVSSKN